MNTKIVDDLLENKKEYPQITCRMSPEEFFEIKRLLSSIQSKLTKISSKEKNKKPLKRNQIFTKALLEGLNSIDASLNSKIKKTP